MSLRLRIRTKLFLILAALITLSVLVTYLFARAEIERDIKESVAEDLQVRAHLVSEAAATAAPKPVDLSAWDALADRLGKRAHARVTLMDRNGVVLGDSEVPFDELPSVDNHGSRPEVVAALEGRVGESQRLSKTVDVDLLYVAVPMKRGDEIFGVARVAMPLIQLDHSLAALREALIVAAALALLLGFAVTGLAVQLVSHTARSLTDSAQRMAGGDLEIRTGAQGQDELGDLGRALDRLAQSLSSTLRKLRRERDRMHGILSNMEEGVLFLDRAGKVALVNPKMKELLVLPSGVEGSTLLEAIRHVELREFLDTARVDRPKEREIRVSGLRPSQLMVRAMRIQGDQGGVLAVFVDVTETRRLEGVRREFVANVSHELRTPVTSIRSAGESLGAALTQPKMAERFVDIIERNAERLQILVEDLLELSRVDANQYSPTLEPVELGPFISRTLSLFADRAQKNQVELSSAVEPEVPLALIDRRAAEHVITNLVDNALKYAGAGKSVTVTVQSGAEGRVEVRVADDGPGIAEKHLPRLFERFYRIDAGRSRELGGTGLGLSIVKNLAESMEGTVRVQSVEGQGTTFIVSLRAVRSDVSSDSAE